MDTANKPAVLFVYYSYTHQTEKIVDTMAEVMVDRGCDVSQGRHRFDRSTLR